MFSAMGMMIHTASALSERMQVRLAVGLLVACMANVVLVCSFL